MDSAKKVAALYCRSAVAGEAAIRSQEEMLTRFGEVNGISDYQVFCDNGASGVTLNRPEFQRMMLGIKRDEIGGVIVTDFARLSRSPVQLSGWLDEMHSLKVRVVSVNDSYDSYESGESILARFAELVNRTLDVVR